MHFFEPVCNTSIGHICTPAVYQYPHKTGHKKLPYMPIPPGVDTGAYLIDSAA